MKKSSIKKLILEALQEVIKENSRSSKINKYLLERERVSRGSEQPPLSRKSIYNPRTGTDQFGNAVKVLDKEDMPKANDFALSSAGSDDDAPYGTIQDADGNVYWLADPNQILGPDGEKPDGMVVQAQSTCDCYSGNWPNGTNNCPDYGEITIYEVNTNGWDGTAGCAGTTINDGWVCCSSNNPFNDTMAETIVLPSVNLFDNTIEAGGDFCYHPEAMNQANPISYLQNDLVWDGPTFPNGQHQITFDEFNEFTTIAGLGEDGLGSCSAWGASYVPGDGTIPDNFCEALVEALESNGNCDQFGCPHPQSNNYEPNRLCNDGFGNGIPVGETLNGVSWYDCCEFEGCGSSMSVPPATNLTEISPLDGFDVVVDDNYSYWVDDQSCQFNYTCLTNEIEINGEFYDTNVEVNGSTGEVGNFVVDSVWYDNTPVTIIEPGCEVSVCAQANMQGADDINIIYDAGGGEVTTNFVALEGSYGSYTVYNNGQCEITADCTDNPDAINYVDETTFNPDNDPDLTYTISTNPEGVCIEFELPEPEWVDCDESLALFLAYEFGADGPNNAPGAVDDEDYIYEGYNLAVVGSVDKDIGFCGYIAAALEGDLADVGIPPVFLQTYLTQIACCESMLYQPIYGCTNGYGTGTTGDNAGNYLGDEAIAQALENGQCLSTYPSTYNATDCTDPIDDGTHCVFQYCFFDPVDTVDMPWPLNWVCFDPELSPLLCIEPGQSVTDGQGGMIHTPCLTTITLQELQADPDLCGEMDNSYTSVFTDTIGDFQNSPDCDYAPVGCLDPGGVQTWGDIGPMITDVWGGAGQANNYNPEYFTGDFDPIPCDGTNSVEECTEGPDGVMQQITDSGAPGYNPYGCCCKYNYGCTTNDDSVINYDPSANQDDGNACEDAVPGCSNPAFDSSAGGNYDPNANTPIELSYQYCVMEDQCFDDGDAWSEIYVDVGGGTPSPYANYICLNDTQITMPDGSTSTIGEELCDCTGFATGYLAGGDTPGVCSAFSSISVNLGSFIDDNGNTYIHGDPFQNGSINFDDYNYDTEGNFGSCDPETMSLPGCLNDPDGDGVGQGTYIYDDGNSEIIVDIVNWNMYATVDTGECVVSGCEDPLAQNYFCNANPEMCVPGPEVYPANHPDAGAPIPILNPIINNTTGISTNADFPCVYAESYDCVGWYDVDDDDDAIDMGESLGCNENIDGTGTYGSLSDCRASCKYCSRVNARLCNGDEEMFFECLLIDSKNGDPTGALDPNEYFMVGDYFKFYDTNDSGAAVVQVDRDGNPIFKDKDVWEVLSIENEVVEESGIQYDQATSAECIPPVYGCTDSTALNYNPDADTDDGSCEYPRECYDIIATQCNAETLTSDFAYECEGMANPGPTESAYTDVSFNCVEFIGGEIPTDINGNNGYFQAPGMWTDLDCPVDPCWDHVCPDSYCNGITDYVNCLPTGCCGNWITFTAVAIGPNACTCEQDSVTTFDDDDKGCEHYNELGTGGANGTTVKWLTCNNGFSWGTEFDSYMNQQGYTNLGVELGISCTECAVSGLMADEQVSGNTTHGKRAPNGDCCIKNWITSTNPTFDTGNPGISIDPYWLNHHGCKYGGSLSSASTCQYQNGGSTGQDFWWGANPVQGQGNVSSAWVVFPCNGTNTSGQCSGFGESYDRNSLTSLLLGEAEKDTERRGDPGAFDPNPGGGDDGDDDGPGPYDWGEGDCCELIYDGNITATWFITSISEPYIVEGTEPQNFNDATDCSDWVSADTETTIDRLDPERD